MSGKTTTVNVKNAEQGCSHHHSWLETNHTILYLQTQIIANIVQFAFILFTMAKEEKVNNKRNRGWGEEVTGSVGVVMVPWKIARVLRLTISACEIQCGDQRV